MSTKVTAVILIELELPDGLAAGDPSTEAARDVILAVAQSVRHRVVAAGVRVGDVHSALTATVPSTP